jgi:hypothetical protein
MVMLTRRRDQDRREECWLIYYGDVHVGRIAVRSRVPVYQDQWSWSLGFYPVSHRGEDAAGYDVRSFARWPLTQPYPECRIGRHFSVGRRCARLRPYFAP